MGFAEKEQARANKKSVVSTIAGVGADEKEKPKMGRPKEDRETKVRKSIAIFPSLYEDIGKIAYVNRSSISEIIDELLTEYVKQNKEKIAEHDRLQK